LIEFYGNEIFGLRTEKTSEEIQNNKKIKLAVHEREELDR